MKNISRHMRCGRRLYSLSPFLVALFCLFTTTNPLHAQWIQTNGPFGGYVYSFAVSPNGAGGTNLFAGTNGGVFLSTNNGTSWTSIGLTSSSIYALAVSGTYLFAGTKDGVFWFSSNNGTSWIGFNTGLKSSAIYALAVCGTNLFKGTDGRGVFLSTNNGISWTAVNTGLGSTEVFSFAVNGTNLFAGTWNGGIFLSTNNGTSWSAVNAGLIYENKGVWCLVFSGTNLFAGICLDGAFRSTDNGASWTRVSNGLPDSTRVVSLAISGNNIFAATSGGGVFLSTNNGTSWTAVNSGLTNLEVLSLAVSGTNLFAGTYGGGVWRRPLSEMTTSVSAEGGSTELSTHFSLEQNYPNPFNPSTTISFSVPSKTFVSLKVFDALGREVASLVSEELHAGTYSLQWNAAGSPSGVYFYRLQTGSFTETKKLLLIR